jgi:hypothetical protein
MKLYCTPVDSFWCCTGTGMENHAKYGDSIYFHSEDRLFVNLFIPSTVSWSFPEKVLVTQTTRFPDEPKTTLKIGSGRAREFSLNIRHPGWCDAVTVTINGRRETVSQAPRSYISIKRVWQDGDVVEIDLPMNLRAVPLPGTTDTLAFVYGPIVLAGRLGNKGIAPGADIIVNERTYGDVLNEPFEVPTLVGDPTKLLESVKPSPEAPLTFKTVGLGKPGDVTLSPYFRIAHERYCMYWKVQPLTI